VSQSPFSPFDLKPDAPAKGAVLLLHGFTGSPWDLRPLGEALARAGYRAVCPLLPGHGEDGGELPGYTEQHWEEAAEAALRQLVLEAQGPVHVVGFSMGALLALVLAANHRGRVRSLSLLAPALRLADAPSSWLRRFRFLPFERVRPWVTKDSTDIRDPAVRALAPLMPRWPLGWIRNFWRLQERAEEVAPGIRVPALLVAADHDAVVSLEGVRLLAARLPAMRRLVRLPRSGHVIPRDVDAARAEQELLAFLSRA
jgi:carboxylesterase